MRTDFNSYKQVSVRKMKSYRFRAEQSNRRRRHVCVQNHLNLICFFRRTRITGGVLSKENQHHETALLCWLSHVCAALKRRIDQEIESGAIDENVIHF